MNPAVPVVDFAVPGDAALAEAVDRALSVSGFMIATGHGIDPGLLERAFGAARRFFALPAAVKDRFAYTDVDANFGYQGVEVERLDPGAMPDLKESFTMRNALKRAALSAHWPDEEFRDTALALFGAGLTSAYRILEVIAGALELPVDYFCARHGGENVTLRFLHYPALAAPYRAAQLGAGAHTDYGSITLLFQDEVGGLELKGADGGWMGVQPMPGAAVINTGDLMERWTNGRFRSTVHRVRPITGGCDRYSIALFVDPDAAVEVDAFDSCVGPGRPRLHAPITAGEHIRRKIAATHT